MQTQKSLKPESGLTLKLFVPWAKLKKRKILNNVTMRHLIEQAPWKAFQNQLKIIDNTCFTEIVTLSHSIKIYLLNIWFWLLA